MAHFFGIFHALSFELNLFFDWRFPLHFAGNRKIWKIKAIKNPNNICMTGKAEFIRLENLPRTSNTINAI